MEGWDCNGQQGMSDPHLCLLSRPPSFSSSGQGALGHRGMFQSEYFVSPGLPSSLPPTFLLDVDSGTIPCSFEV